MKPRFDNHNPGFAASADRKRRLINEFLRRRRCGFTLAQAARPTGYSYRTLTGWACDLGISIDRRR